jgi:lipoprotein signal peptidase
MIHNNQLSQTLFSKQNVFLFLASVILIALNLGVSFFIRRSDLFFVANQTPFGLNIGLVSVTLIVIGITLGLYCFDYIHKYPVVSLLIIAGSWSNLLERMLFGSVTDYISFVISFINLADIQIWIGLIALNAQIWFLDRAETGKEPTKISK